jgi:hemoglobin/transferrin/lactoferrin receptor protein
MRRVGAAMVCRTRSAKSLLFGASTIALMAQGIAGAQAQAVSLDPITVVATKTEEKAIDSLAGVSTVRQDQIDQIMPVRTTDLFYGLPSVWFQTRGDQPETSINIRGLQDFGRVAVLIDGARQNFQRSGHNANGTFFLEPELLAGLDVVRGPVANVYGSGAIGGVASFRTKDADDILRPGERWATLGHVMGASNQAQGLGSIFAAARPNQNIDLFAGGTIRSMANYEDGNGDEVVNTANKVATAIGKFTVRPADGHEFKLSALNYNAWYNTGQQFPNQESVYDTNVVNNIVSARWRYARPEDRLFDFDGNVYWTETIQDQRKIANGIPGSLGNPITGSIGDQRSFGIDTKGFDLHNTSRFDVGPFRNALTYGGDFFRDEVENRDPTGNGEVTTPSGVRTVSGAFTQWRVNYSTWLEAITALRYDTYRLEGNGTTSEGDHLSPKATLGVTPINGITVYGTFAGGYRAPAVTETLVAGPHPPFAVGFPNLFTFLPNPDLRPEIGQTKELGLNLKYDNVWSPGDKIRAKFNVFRNDIDDYIDLFNFGPPIIFQFCPAPFPGCPPVPRIPIPINTFSFAQYQNIPNARIEGVELEATYDAGTWFAGVAGQHMRGKDLITNEPLASIPPDKISTTLGVRMFEQRVTASVRWTAVAAKKASEIPDRDHNGIPDFLPTDAYNLVNLYLGYSPTPDVTASVAIENVLNEFCIPYLAGTPNIPGNPPGVVFPRPGITYKAGLHLRFGGA